jgi:hypothetical protein
MGVLEMNTAKSKMILISLIFFSPWRVWNVPMPKNHHHQQLTKTPKKRTAKNYFLQLHKNEIM